MRLLWLKRPLAAVFLAYAAGLILAQCFHPPLHLLVVVGVLLLLSGLFIRRYRIYFLGALLVLTGWANFIVHTAVLSPTDIRRLVGDDPQVVTVRGELAATPELRILQQRGDEHWRSVARVRVRQIALHGEWEPAEGEVMAATQGVLAPEYFAGQRVQITGVISRPPPQLAEGMFDFRSYLAARGIYYQLRTDTTNDWLIGEPRVSRAPLGTRFLNWAHGVLALGLPGEDEPLRLLWAMTLGWRTAFTGDVGDPFLRAGTMHMFAIDGLRIGMVAGMIVMLLRMGRLSRAWCGAVAIPVIWFYTVATGCEASAVRASVMMTVVLGGWALKRPGDLLNSLSAAALIILVLDPRQIGEAGFQLSFCVMLVIALMLPPLNDLLETLIVRWVKWDPLLPDDLVPGWRKYLVIMARRFGQFFALSLAAWVGSLPLAAKYFHLFSPVSVLANLVAVPLGALALMADLGALLCGHWLPWLTGIFNHAAWFYMVAMTWVSREAASLPGAYFYVPEPATVTVLIYYAVVVAAFSGWFGTMRRWGIGGIVLLLIASVYGWRWERSRTETDVTVLPLNGGHAVYVDADGRRNDWLINCGSANAVEFTLKNFLRGQGVNQVPRLVLADAEARNCGGAALLDQLFGVGELWTSGAAFRSAAYRNAVAAFDEPRHQVLKCGDTIGRWHVLYPDTIEHPGRAEDGAVVLRGDFPAMRVLLMGELSRAGQSDLLARADELRADIVVASLPEDGQPLCDALLAAVQPRVIVIADSEYPASRRAGRALKERLARLGVPVWYTRTAGTVKIVIRPDGWRVAE